MTKEQFLEKYLNQWVLICDEAKREWSAYTKKSKTITDDPGVLTEAKKRLSVEYCAGRFPNPISSAMMGNVVFALCKKNQSPNYQIGYGYDFSLLEFVEDFISFCEYEDAVKTKLEQERLEGLRIYITEEIGKVGEKYTEIVPSDIKTTKDAENLGFINGFTNTKISLWWNVDGVRLVFARGYGVFELK